MVGKIGEVIDSMESGVYNFCKDGKCIGCGECCSALLPISEKELRVIKRYVKKKKLKPHRHMAVASVALDMTCPFLDSTKSSEKCDIYSVRPKICREFICCQPPSKVKANKELFWSTRKAYYMWDLFKEEKDVRMQENKISELAKEFDSFFK